MDKVGEALLLIAVPAGDEKFGADCFNPRTIFKICGEYRRLRRFAYAMM